MLDRFLSRIFSSWLMFAILAVALTLSKLDSREAKAQPDLAEFPFHHAGQFIVDASGRVVLFHGVNLVNKFPPYTPSAAGFREVDAKLMAEAGWNVVRLGVLYSEDGLNDTAHTQGCCCCGGNEITNCAQINVNILAYALLY